MFSYNHKSRAASATNDYLNYRLISKLFPQLIDRLTHFIYEISENCENACYNVPQMEVMKW